MLKFYQRLFLILFSFSCIFIISGCKHQNDDHKNHDTENNHKKVNVNESKTKAKNVEENNLDAPLILYSSKFIPTIDLPASTLTSHCAFCSIEDYYEKIKWTSHKTRVVNNNLLSEKERKINYIVDFYNQCVKKEINPEDHYLYALPTNEVYYHFLDIVLPKKQQEDGSIQLIQTFELERNIKFSNLTYLNQIIPRFFNADLNKITDRMPIICINATALCADLESKKIMNVCTRHYHNLSLNNCTNA